MTKEGFDMTNSFYSNCILVAIKAKIKDHAVKIGFYYNLKAKPFFGVHCWWEKNGKEYHFKKDDDVLIGWLNYFWHKGSIKEG